MIGGHGCPDNNVSSWGMEIIIGPADVLAANWMLGTPAAFDTVTYPHKFQIIFLKRARSAAIATEHQNKDGKCAELG